MKAKVSMFPSDQVTWRPIWRACVSATIVYMGRQNMILLDDDEMGVADKQLVAGP